MAMQGKTNNFIDRKDGPKEEDLFPFQRFAEMIDSSWIPLSVLISQNSGVRGLRHWYIYMVSDAQREQMSFSQVRSINVSVAGLWNISGLFYVQRTRGQNVGRDVFRGRGRSHSL